MGGRAERLRSLGHEPPAPGGVALIDQGEAAQRAMDERWPFNESITEDPVLEMVIEHRRTQAGSDLVADERSAGGRAGASDSVLWWPGRVYRVPPGATTEDLAGLAERTAPDLSTAVCDLCATEGCAGALVVTHGRDLVGLTLCWLCAARDNAQSPSSDRRRWARLSFGHRQEDSR